MAVSMGGQDAFKQRVQRIAQTEGTGTLFVGMDTTCRIGQRHTPKANRGTMLRFGILGAVLVMPAAAYAQGLVDVTPEQAVNYLNLAMNKVMSFIS
jgi:hypothetical protein